MTRTYLACLALAGALLASGATRAGIIEDLAGATIVEDFRFGDAAGTLYNAAANSANAGNLLSTSASLAGVATIGSGQLNASLKSNFDLGTTLVDTPINLTSRRVFGVMELTWNFTSTFLAGDSPSDTDTTPDNEEIRISLISSGTSTVTAEWEIERGDNNTSTTNDADQLVILGTAVGAGSNNIAPQVLNGGSLIQTTKFVAVVEANLDTDKYWVHYSSDGGGSFTTMGPETLDPARIVDKLRVVLNNDLSGDNILIDRVYLATVPEPGCFVLALVAFSAGVSFIGRRR